MEMMEENTKEESMETKEEAMELKENEPSDNTKQVNDLSLMSKTIVESR
jgi:hypothetical protein